MGEIYDEYDRGEPLPQSDAGGTVLPGDMEIENLPAQPALGIGKTDYQTIGGHVFGALGRLPRVGDRVQLENAVLEVQEMDGRRIAKLKVIPLQSTKSAGT